MILDKEYFFPSTFRFLIKLPSPDSIYRTSSKNSRWEAARKAILPLDKTVRGWHKRKRFMTSYRSSLSSERLNYRTASAPASEYNKSSIDRTNDQNETGWPDFPALMICLSLDYDNSIRSHLAGLTRVQHVRARLVPAPCSDTYAPRFQ